MGVGCGAGRDDRPHGKSSKGESLLRETVSWSEIITWCTCRMKWYWSYGLRIAKVRLERAPTLGSAGHAGLTAMVRGQPYGKAIDEWLKRELKDRELFDEEIEEYHQIAEMAVSILDRYAEHYKKEPFAVVEAEEKFSVPISGTKIRLIGYRDMVVQDMDGCLWNWEHKFPQQFRKEEDVELDSQTGIYQYVSHRTGYPVIGTVYNQLLARLPAIPKINKDGSVSRQKIYTDWDTYSKIVTEQGFDPANYLDMQEKLAGYEFFKRFYIYRSSEEIRIFAREMERRVWDLMKTKKHIYMCESPRICNSCSYRELCLTRLQGGDLQGIIEMDYEPKRKRDKEPEELEETNGEEELVDAE